MRVSREEREYLLENLSLFLSSGMGVVAAMEALAGEVRSRGAKALASRILEELDSGSSLWRALDQAKIFPQRVISLIRVGERSGRMAQNLKAAVLQQQKERIFRSRVASALFYPVLVLGVTVMVGLGVSWFLLPRLAAVFVSLNIDLPLLTRILIGWGEFLNRYGAVAVPAFAALLIGLGFVIGRLWGDVVLLAVPGVNRLVKEVELSRFGFILGSLLDAGLPISDALDSLEESTSFRAYRSFYRYLGENVKEGNTFRKSFTSYKRGARLFPAPVRYMVSSAEQSGRLPETLLSIGDTYEARVDDTAKNLTVVLEPILLIIVWLGVVLVALAVILPIYGLIGGLAL